MTIFLFDFFSKTIKMFVAVKILKRLNENRVGARR